MQNLFKETYIISGNLTFITSSFDTSAEVERSQMTANLPFGLQHKSSYE